MSERELDRAADHVEEPPGVRQVVVVGGESDEIVSTRLASKLGEHLPGFRLVRLVLRSGVGWTVELGEAVQDAEAVVFVLSNEALHPDSHLTRVFPQLVERCSSAGVRLASVVMRELSENSVAALDRLEEAVAPEEVTRLNGFESPFVNTSGTRRTALASVLAQRLLSLLPAGPTAKGANTTFAKASESLQQELRRASDSFVDESLTSFLSESADESVAAAEPTTPRSMAGFTCSTTAGTILKLARRLAHQFARQVGKMGTVPIEPRHVVVSLVSYGTRVRHGGAVQRFAKLLAELDAEARRSGAAPAARLALAAGLSIDDIGVTGVRRDAEVPLVELDDALRATIERAVEASRATGSEGHVRSRHLLGALLLGAGAEAPGSARALLDAAGYDVPRLLRELVPMLARDDADRAAWRELAAAAERAEATTEPAVDVPPLVGLNADLSERGVDCLDVTPEVHAMASVLAAREVQLPLSIGLFGDWGTGKTFFMERLAERVAQIAGRSREAEVAGEPTDFHAEVCQITFNAWHYIDTSLWASLVHRIFEGLAEHLQPEGGGEADPALFQQLASAREIHEEARAELERAREDRAAAEAELAELARRREAAACGLEHFRVQSFRQLIAANPALEEKLDAVAEQVGLPQLARSREDLEASYRELTTTLGQLRATVLSTFRGEGWQRRLGWVAAAAIAIWILPRLVVASTGEEAALGTLLAQLGTGAAGFLGWVRTAVAKAGEATKSLREGLEETLRLAERAGEVPPTPRERELREEVVRLAESESAAERAHADAVRRLEAAQRAIDTVEQPGDGRRLARFIEERLASEDYRSHLGLISVVRRDLERLSAILEAGLAERRALAGSGGGSPPGADAPERLPRIDRIVLYVDDLDRCPHERVVEVLQAVHLLLAFKSFAVVVGVDSRWLVRSLELGVSALGRREAEAVPLSPDEVHHWESTPQNYLEKIFQIPYALRPMDAGGFGQLLEHLLPEAQESTDVDVDVVAPAGASDGEDADDGSGLDGTARPPEEPEQDGGAPDGEADEREALETVELVPAPPPPPALVLTPPQLEITGGERRFLRELAGLVPTPRATKRLVNVYRLLRASLSDDDLARFVVDGGSRGSYQAALVLLALQTGHPRKAERVLRKLFQRDPKGAWADFVAELRPARRGKGDKGPIANAAEPGLRGAKLHEWRHLHHELERLVGLTQGCRSLGDYRWAARRVARYSFQTGRVIGSAGSSVGGAWAPTAKPAPADEPPAVRPGGARPGSREEPSWSSPS